MEKLYHEFFRHIHDVFLIDKAQLHIDLRKFRLPVGTQVLVTEAAHDLEVFLKAGDHQQLLEKLGRLRQGIKAPLV